MVSHIVSTFSGKPIFGQDGPKYLWNISQQTICRELIIQFNQNTTRISQLSQNMYLYIFNGIARVILLSRAVIIFVLIYNPQITKARINYLYKYNHIYKIVLSMWVGISETIRLLFLIFNSLILVSHRIYPISTRSFYSSLANNSDNQGSIIFNQWLAGLIDGDGCFQLS